MVLFAVCLPAQNPRGPQYMDQPLAAIHEGNPRHLPITLSLVRHEQSVALVYHVPQELAALVQSQLYAAYPDCTIERLPDQALDLPTGARSWFLSSSKQKLFRDRKAKTGRH